ncbi:MAG TPA: hypothetical protein VFA83_04380 [Acidimicrobiales bacterium]|nr:hypothetical protein [Acidimicrobiales bacterium]
MKEFPKIISVDDHVVEPANVWTDRLPSKYLDVGPRVERRRVGKITFIGGKFTAVPAPAGEGDGPEVDWWFYEDLVRPLIRLDAAVGYPREEVTLKGVTFDDMRPGAWQVKPRLEDMDTNWIEASLCFPTFRASAARRSPRPRTTSSACCACRPTTIGWWRSGAVRATVASSR